VELFKRKNSPEVPVTTPDADAPVSNETKSSTPEIKENGAEEILAAQLRDAQNIEGMVVGFVNADSMKVTITREGDCLRIVGKKTNKVIPLSNIRSYDCLTPGRPRPVVPRK